MKDKRKEHTVNLLNKLKYPLQLNMLCFFFREDAFTPGSEDELTEQFLAGSISSRYTDND